MFLLPCKNIFFLKHSNIIIFRRRNKQFFFLFQMIYIIVTNINRLVEEIVVKTNYCIQFKYRETYEIFMQFSLYYCIKTILNSHYTSHGLMIQYLIYVILWLGIIIIRNICGTLG